MTHCSRCSAENQQNAKFCTVCGGRLESAIQLPEVKPLPPAFPAMRGMAPAPAPAPEPHFAPMRGMAPAPDAQPEPPSTRAIVPQPNVSPAPGPPTAIAPAPSAPTPMAAAPIAMPAPSYGSISPPEGFSATRPATTSRSPAVATVLSIIFPSAGQFYNGDTKKGITMLAIEIVGALFVMIVGAPALAMPIGLGIWLWSIFDAGKVARGQRAAW